MVTEWEMKGLDMTVREALIVVEDEYTDGEICASFRITQLMGTYEYYIAKEDKFGNVWWQEVTPNYDHTLRCIHDRLIELVGTKVEEV